MRRGTGVVALLALVALGSQVAAPGPASGLAGRTTGRPAAYVAPSTVRVPLTAPAGRRLHAELEAARGETESFQVVVRAVGGSLRGVRLAASDLRTSSGQVIGRRQLALYREHYVRVRRPSPAWSGKPLGWRFYPDALVPFVDPVTGRPPRAGARYRAAPFSVPPGRNQPLWVDVTVPRTAPAGTYRGTWTVRTRQGSRTGRLTVRVRDVTLPVRPSSGSRFAIWQARNRRPAVERLLLRHRLQPSPVRAARETSLQGSGLHTVDLGFWSGADVDTCRMTPAPDLDSLRSAVASRAPGNRLIDYSADEVTECAGLVRRLRTWARRLHAVGVDHLVTVVPRAELMDDGTGRPVVDLWVLTPWQLRALDPALRAQVESRGGELWSYQALVQGRRTPSWQLDFPVTHYRVLPGFLNQSQGVTGTLYWAVDRWQRDPWTDPTYVHTTSCCYPGDGTLVYPGRPAGVVGVVPSVRLAMVRDGMDDFDLVALMRAQGRAEEALRIVASAASGWSTWTTDGRVLAGVRHRLLDALEAG
ncbi:MAG: glycoside hydrolase domain-containing protein [Actinomycetes bacterium]